MESWSFQESSSVFQTNRDVERSQSLRKNRQFRSKRFKDRVTSRSQKPTTKRNFTSKAFQEIPVIEKSIADVQARQVSLSFKKVSLEILQSLVGDVKVKRFIGNLSGDSEKNIMSTVFWPTVWDGIWRQYTLDVPRCNIHFKGTKWVDPFLLFMSLGKPKLNLWFSF